MKTPATSPAACPEMDLLCACLGPARAAAVARWPFRERPIDWPRFLALATNHHVIPQVYQALKSAAGRERVPADCLAPLRASQLSIAAHNLRALATLHRIQQALAGQGISIVPVKGPALAVLAYGDLAQRQFEDLDLLVRSSDLLRTVAWLEQDGFALRELPAGASRPRFLATRQDWALQNRGGMLIDLKPVLGSHILAGPETVEFMAAACRPLATGEKWTLSAPGPEAMLLAVCLDGAADMWGKLSSVADVDALISKFPAGDWASFLSRAAGFGQKRAVLVGAFLAENLLGCELPAAFHEAGRKDAVASRLAMLAARRLRSLAPRHAVPARQNWFAFRTRERLRDRWRFWTRLLFVPGAFEWHALPLPGALQPLYALIRPFRLAWDVWGRGGRARRLPMRPGEHEMPPGSAKT